MLKKLLLLNLFSILMLFVFLNCNVQAFAQSSFTVAEVFGDNMVLQRDKPIKIWGECSPNSYIVVNLNGTAIKAIVEGNRWEVELPKMEANTDCFFEVYNDMGEKIKFENVAIGEVWIAGGQSNMEFKLKDDIEASKELPLANNSNIRYFECPKVEYEGQQKESGKWEICNPKTAKNFSAVSYYFAQQLYEHLNIPVGIISCNFSGTNASTWLREDYLQNDDLKVCIVAYESYLKKHQSDYEEAIKTVNRPAGLYHTMVERIIPYTVKGVLWYQGESDSERAELYDKLFTAVIKCWREQWNENLPFLFVQLPPFESFEDFTGDNFPYIREQQELVSKTVLNTYMISIMDSGDQFDLHPTKKRPVGERLALLARGKVYGEDILCEPPELINYTINENFLDIAFENAGDGLYIEGQKANGFELFVNSQKVEDFGIEINQNTIKILSPLIQKNNKINVLFAQSPYVEVNIYNSAKLCMKPFKIEY